MITDSVIIQVDATIIAGLFIMISISSIWSSKDGKIKPVTNKIRSKLMYLTPKGIFSAVVPFSASAILILLSSNDNDVFRFFGLFSMLFGFGLTGLFGGIIAFSEKEEELDLD